MIAFLLTIVLLGVFPLDVILPSIPTLSLYFGTPVQNMGLTLSLFIAVVAMSQLVIGPLSDATGRKKVLLCGISLAVIGALGCAQASDFSSFLFFRMLQALGCGCFGLANALVQDMFLGTQRDSVRMITTTAGGIFICLSPLAGTALQAIFDWPGSFYGFCVVALIVLFAAARLLKPDDVQRPVRHDASIMGSYATLLALPGFMSYCVVAAIAFACHFAFIVMSPIVFLDRLGFSQLEFSWVLMAYGTAYLGSGWIAHAVHGKLGRDRQLLPGIGLIGLSGSMLIAFDALIGLSVAGILLPMIFCTVGTTLTRTAATGKAMDICPQRAGAASSLLSTVVFLIGGGMSALASLSNWAPAVTLGVGFIGLSGVAALIIAMLK